MIDKRLAYQYGGGADAGGKSSPGGGDFGNENFGGQDKGDGGNNYQDRIQTIARQQRVQELADLANRDAADKAEIALEVFRNRNRGSNFIDKALNFVPGIGTIRRVASTFGPYNNRDFFLDKVAPSNFGALSTSQQQEIFDQYMSARGRNEIDAYGNKIDSSSGGLSTLPLFTQAPIATGIQTLQEQPIEENSFYEMLRRNLGLV